MGRWTVGSRGVAVVDVGARCVEMTVSNTDYEESSEQLQFQRRVVNSK